MLLGIPPLRVRNEESKRFFLKKEAKTFANGYEISSPALAGGSVGKVRAPRDLK